ncbi:EamA family transporter [Stigmatella sp. ncwal1]|uniref:EamA family transporter n=1 Tax=Stigmatella ashevillensis TaxID=2995309 RepID=A0ABT5DJJ5_9BACT|nr:EamA family transporter [Stigmatella ashevillena]MDC0713330.1 EamA family transporter [Stigmatella ashevillena]
MLRPRSAMVPTALPRLTSATSPLKLVLAYCTCFLLWGSTWVVVKVGLEDLPPLRFAGIRMLVAGLMLLPFARTQGAQLGARTTWRIVGLGCIQLAIPFGLLFIGQQWIPTSWSSLLFSTFPVWLLLVGRVLLPDQPLTAPKLMAAGLGVVGVMALQQSQLGQMEMSSLVLLGGLLTLGATALMALANVLVKRHMAHVPPHILVFIQTLSSAVPLLGMSFLLEGAEPVNWTSRAVLAVVYLALGGTVLTYQCFYWLLQRLSLTAIGVMSLLDTLVAVALGVVMLHEPLTPSLLVGGTLILSSAALAQFTPDRQTATA